MKTKNNIFALFSFTLGIISSVTSMYGAFSPYRPTETAPPEETQTTPVKITPVKVMSPDQALPPAPPFGPGAAAAAAAAARSFADSPTGVSSLRFDGSSSMTANTPPSPMRPVSTIPLRIFTRKELDVDFFKELEPHEQSEVLIEMMNPPMIRSFSAISLRSGSSCQGIYSVNNFVVKHSAFKSIGEAGKYMNKIKTAAGPNGIAAIHIEGRYSSAVARTVALTHTVHKDDIDNETTIKVFEVMEKAPGRSIYEMVNDPSVSEESLFAAFFKVGELMSKMHQSRMQNFDRDPLQYRTIVHGDAHLNNIFHDEITQEATFIDFEKSAHSTAPNQPYTPFFDIIKTIFSSFSFGELNDANKVIRTTYALNGFLKGYITALPEEKREVFKSLTQELIKVWFEIALTFFTEEHSNLPQKFLDSRIGQALNINSCAEYVEGLENQWAFFVSQYADQKMLPDAHANFSRTFGYVHENLFAQRPQPYISASVQARPTAVAGPARSLFDSDDDDF